jgi:hypothetical protein
LAARRDARDPCLPERCSLARSRARVDLIASGSEDWNDHDAGTPNPSSASSLYSANMTMRRLKDGHANGAPGY